MSIVIIGAGGHGRGVLEILVAIGLRRNPVRIGDPAARNADAVDARSAAFEIELESFGRSAPQVTGFLDDAPERQGATVGGVPVLGPTERAGELAAEGSLFLIGLGDPMARHAMAVHLEADGIRFATAIHPSAVIYRDTTIAEGSVVAAGVVIAASTQLRRHSLVNLNASIGHDCLLDEFATVGPGANLGGNVRLGRLAFVGLNATVVPGKQIGNGSVLGAGSVMLEDLPDDVTAFGVPARIVHRRSRS